MKMLYTANGRYIRCCTEEGTRPVIIVCEKEYEVDVQEFMLWSILNWAHPAGRGNQQLLREDGEQFQCHHPPQLAGLCAAPASSRAHCGWHRGYRV